MVKRELILIEGLDELSITVHYMKDINIHITKAKILEAKRIIQRDKHIYLLVKRGTIPFLNITHTSSEFLTLDQVKLKRNVLKGAEFIRDSENGDLAEKSIQGTSVLISLALVAILVWVLFFRFSNPSY